MIQIHRSIRLLCSISFLWIFIFLKTTPLIRILLIPIIFFNFILFICYFGLSYPLFIIKHLIFIILLRILAAVKLLYLLLFHRHVSAFYVCKMLNLINKTFHIHICKVFHYHLAKPLLQVLYCWLYFVVNFFLPVSIITNNYFSYYSCFIYSFCNFKFIIEDIFFFLGI